MTKPKDLRHCPCGYTGAVTSEAPPFWEVDGQTWHWDCLVAAHPERRQELEAAKDSSLGKHPTWRAWVGKL